MKTKFKYQVGERRNSKPPLRWMRGMSIYNANGDLDIASAGFSYAVDTTSQIRSRVVKQKYFEIAPADYFRVVPGEGAWKESLITVQSFDVAGDFASGIIGSVTRNARLAEVDAGMVPRTTPLVKWAKGYGYDHAELESAVAAGNWQPIIARQEALKKHADLGLQHVAFLGLPEAGITGFLNNADVAIDTTTIDKMISEMTADEFATFVSTIAGVYRENAARTAWPTKFAIPEDDYLGLVGPTSPGFPVGSKLEYMEKAFQKAFRNPGFELLPLAYANKSMNAGVLDSDGKNRYVLYQDDSESLQMDVPVPFFLRAPGTGNNWSFEGVGAMQFGPVVWFRPKTALYLDHE